MKRSREQARDLRTGRAWTTRAGKPPAPPGASPATRYASITTHLPGLRTALAATRPDGLPLPDLRRGYAELDRALANAMAFAFTADAQGAPTPAGIVSWAAEGLARSYERELAMFAAMDICGLSQPMTSPHRRWGYSRIPR